MIITMEQGFDRLYNMVATEAANAEKIINSLGVLKEANILTEEDQQVASQTFKDKVQLVWQKVVQFYNQIKIKLIGKFNDLVDKKISLQLQNIKKNPSISDTINIDRIPYVSDKTWKEFEDYTEYYADIIKRINEAIKSYDDTRMTSASNENIENKPLPKIEYTDKHIVHLGDDYAINEYEKEINDHLKFNRDKIASLKKKMEEHATVLNDMIKEKKNYSMHSEAQCVIKAIQCFNHQLKATQVCIMAVLKTIFYYSRALGKIDNFNKKNQND